VIVDPVACGLFLLVAFMLAGLAQTAWFAAPASRRFAQPLDGGRRFRGRRILGAHKTIRGFVVMVPAAATAFSVLGGAAPGTLGLWPLSPLQYAALGAAAGLGFMLGELPNSFVKRQLDIAPGATLATSRARTFQFVIDRLDSGLGMLIVVSVAVPTPWTSWVVVLLFGPVVHWSFSVLMFRLGLKARPA
jgi:CDP-2,3-bis-(O-geranylgeranyl)-sn-glycerol synthase